MVGREGMAEAVLKLDIWGKSRLRLRPHTCGCSQSAWTWRPGLRWAWGGGRHEQDSLVLRGSLPAQATPRLYGSALHAHAQLSGRAARCRHEAALHAVPPTPAPATRMRFASPLLSASRGMLGDVVLLAAMMVRGAWREL